MAKELNCFNYFPGDVTKVNGEYISNMLSRTAEGDNQRRTSWNYIYSDDNLLGGK